MTKQNVRRGHDRTGRSTSRPASARVRTRIGPPEGSNWIWMTREMLESPALGSLSSSSLRALARLMLEHLRHAGWENGNLACTYSDFERYGIRRASISRAIGDLIEKGFVRVSVQGGRCYGAGSRPSRYRLTWIGTLDGSPTNEWKAYQPISPDAKSEPSRARKRALIEYKSADCPSK
jgi:hypothetical protein